VLPLIHGAMRSTALVSRDRHNATELTAAAIDSSSELLRSIWSDVAALDPEMSPIAPDA
jgi:hypothetical protein